jgi:hypothetical protein
VLCGEAIRGAAVDNRPDHPLRSQTAGVQVLVGDMKHTADTKGSNIRYGARAARDPRVALAALIAALALMVVVPGGARGASLAQVRHQLSGWHLRPWPLFPSALPAGLQSTNVTLDRSSGDYVVTFARPDCSGSNFCVYYKRGPWSWLDSIQQDPATTFIERLQVGTRSVYAAETGHAGAPSLLAWHQQNRTYMAVARYVGLSDAIAVLAPLVESLQPLPTPPADPCAQRWPAGRSVRHNGGRLIYDRQASLRMVCQGFGTDTGGLQVNWLTWGMKCALVATAIGARYGEDAEFAASGACSVAEVAQHPGAVSLIGAACSTASDLLGLPYRVLGTVSGLACEAAPAVGTGFGTWLESHHEFAVARDVMRKGRCIEYRQYFGVSSWHAVRCP